MATRSAFPFYTSTREQNLFASLVRENIEIYGHDMYYLPRTKLNTDDMMNEVRVVEFNSALPVELYIKNVDTFEGDGTLLSKFAGLQIQDRMTLCMSFGAFEDFVKPSTNKARPMEGDIIFVPMLKVAYQISYVKKDAIFYALGKLNMYQLDCEMFENQGEIFDTGVTMIDNLYPNRPNADDPGYDIDINDLTADNDPMETEGDNILDFSESDPFTDGGNP